MKIRERILIKLRGEDFHIRVLLICVIFSAIACNDNIKSKKLEAQVEDNTPMGCAVPTASGIDSKDLDIELLLAISEIREDPNVAKDTFGMVKITRGTFEMGGDTPDGFDNMPKPALAQGDEFPNAPCANKLVLDGYT